uniref:Ig-like domain-containing protein n=1 Tax=Anopheles minimus TaxID=112268 RepID=A0A182VZG3_9DIPT
MGNAATLSCQFELEKATLYSVRWYFEGEEFYRFVPKESPPARTFPVSGITVDHPTCSAGSKI